MKTTAALKERNYLFVLSQCRESSMQMIIFTSLEFTLYTYCMMPQTDIVRTLITVFNPNTTTKLSLNALKHFSTFRSMSQLGPHKDRSTSVPISFYYLLQYLCGRQK